MPSILGANSVTGYDVSNSLMFNDGDSPKLSRSISSAGSTTNATLSVWVKRGILGTRQQIYSNKTADSGFSAMNMYFNAANDRLYIDHHDGSNNKSIYTNMRFRDVAAWYHIVHAIDTTTNTATNRLRVYVNGTEITSFATDQEPAKDADLAITNATGDQSIGDDPRDNNDLFDGYMAEYNFVDGATLDPTSFGETDDNGVWVPKQPTVSAYGTNGFKLEFKQTGTSANAAGIGADTSGNGNHMTVTNLAATDVGIDTPTNNYCTINSVYADDGNNLVAADFSQGNRKMFSTNDGWKFGRGTFLLEAGKWYVEVKATEAGAGENGRFGLQPSQGGEALGNTDDNDTFEGINVGFAGSDTNLQKLDTGSGSTIFSNFTSGSTAMIAYDLDNDKVWIGSNGTWYNDNNASTTLDASNHDFALPTVSLGWVFGLGMTRNGSNNITFEYNWGNPAHAISSGNSDADGHGNFEYPVPSGFFAVNSKNLAEYG